MGIGEELNKTALDCYFGISCVVNRLNRKRLTEIETVQEPFTHVYDLKRYIVAVMMPSRWRLSFSGRRDKKK